MFIREKGNSQGRTIPKRPARSLFFNLHRCSFLVTTPVHDPNVLAHPGAWEAGGREEGTGPAARRGEGAQGKWGGGSLGLCHCRPGPPSNTCRWGVILVTKQHTFKGRLDLQTPMEPVTPLHHSSLRKWLGPRQGRGTVTPELGAARGGWPGGPGTVRHS